MIQCIFHKRLENKIRERHSRQGIVDVIGNLNGFAVGQKLYLHIGLDIQEFIFQGGHILSLVQRGPVKGGQQKNHIADFILTGDYGLAVDQRQGIIEKMRIDLCVQDFLLVRLFLQLIFQVYLDIMVDFFHHSGKILEQDSDLILPFVIQLDGKGLETGIPYLAYLCGKALYRRYDGGGENEDHGSQKEQDYPAEGIDSAGDSIHIFQQHPVAFGIGYSPACGRKPGGELDTPWIIRGVIGRRSRRKNLSAVFIRYKDGIIVLRNAQQGREQVIIVQLQGKIVHTFVASGIPYLADGI